MVNITCDRCNKPLNDGEGYQVHVMARCVRVPGGIQGGNYIPNPDGDAPFAGEVCAGCYDMLHFLLFQRFKEVKAVA